MPGSRRAQDRHFRTPAFISDGKDGGIPKGTRSVSLFLVNRRKPSPDDYKDEAFAFQAQLEVAWRRAFRSASQPSQPGKRRLGRTGSRLAVSERLRIRGRAQRRDRRDSERRPVAECYGPAGFRKPRWSESEPSDIKGVELSMDALSQLTRTAKTCNRSSAPWSPAIAPGSTRRRPRFPHLPSDAAKRRKSCCKRAKVAANRIEQGIALLE